MSILEEEILIVAQLVIKMKKIIFILIMISTILCVSLNVKATENDV